MRLPPFPWDAQGNRNQPQVFSNLSASVLRLRGLAEGEEMFLVPKEQTNVGDGAVRENWFKIQSHEFFLAFIMFPTFFHFCFIVIVTSIFPLPFHTLQKLRGERLCGLPKVIEYKI